MISKVLAHGSVSSADHCHKAAAAAAAAVLAVQNIATTKHCSKLLLKCLQKGSNGSHIS
jgi:hypothetical protein